MRGKAAHRGGGASGIGEVETNSDGRVCAVLQSLLRGGDGGKDGRQCVQSAWVTQYP